MELVFAGLCLIVSAILLKESREINKVDDKSAPEKLSFEFYGTAFLGLILFLIGIVGLFFGIYAIKPSSRESITLFFLVFALNIQARLLNFSSVNNEEAKCLNDRNTNGMEVLRKALSVGFFPRNGSYIFLIHACQFFQFLFLFLFLFLYFY